MLPSYPPMHANPPDPAGITSEIWMYEWEGGTNFSSNLRNPFIPLVSAADAGTYSVTITGLSGCTAVGQVQVGIENLPPEPVISAATEVCADEQIILDANVINNASVYKWYENVVGPDVLIAETTDAELIIPGPLPQGVSSYYVIVETMIGCESNSSNVVEIEVIERPIATAPADTVICEGESLSLFTELPNVDYQWIGPTAFSSDQQIAVISDSLVQSIHNGIYTLVVSRGSCVSEPDTAVVTVLPKPAQPDLFSNSALCEGEELILTTTEKQRRLKTKH